jgi:outer membrane protein OmpA-like peptidoglycan-associated protein
LYVRPALGILLAMGLADLALLNLHLAPQLAAEQLAEQHQPVTSPVDSGARVSPVSPGSTGAVPPVAPPTTASAVAAVAVVSAAPTRDVPSVAVKEPVVPSAVAVAPPPPPPVPVAAVPSTPGEPVEDILFDLDRQQVNTLPAIIALRRVAQELAQDSSKRVLIRGHADQMGSSIYKHALSERRARAVQAFLMSHGAPADRITVEAVSDSEPVDSGSNPVAWAKNRRVQVLWR